MKIAMIIAPKGYQDMEFGVPYEYFEGKGAQVDVFSTKKGVAQGAFGASFDVQNELKDLDVLKYDAIVYVGGPGTPQVRKDVYSQKIAKDAIESKKILAAICWSPTILAMAGVLKGKQATVWKGEDQELGMLTSDYLRLRGATYTGKDVTVDGSIITADGPSSAHKYATAIWDELNKIKTK